MRYMDKSFTVPASAGNAAYCAEHGHTLPDQRGNCLRCSAKVRIADVVRGMIGPDEHVAVIDSQTRCSNSLNTSEGDE